MEAVSRASPLVSVLPPDSAARRENPQPLSASSTTVSTARASSTRRRDASRRVSAAMVSTVRAVVTARLPTGRGAVTQDAEQALLQADPRRARPRAPVRRGRPGRAPGRERPFRRRRPERHGEPVAGPLDLAGRGQPRLRRRGDVGQLQPQLALAEQLGEGARCGDPSPVEDDHPVADPLDLADQVRVEQHRDAPRLQLQHDVAHVGAAERVQRAGRLVQDHELRPGHQGDRQPEALLHPLREAAHAGRRRVRPGRRGPGSRAAPARSPSIPDSRTWRASTSAALSHGWYRKSSGR